MVFMNPFVIRCRPTFPVDIVFSTVRCVSVVSYVLYLVVIAIGVFEYRAGSGGLSYRESVRVIRYRWFEQLGVKHWVDLIHCR